MTSEFAKTAFRCVAALRRGRTAEAVGLAEELAQALDAADAPDAAFALWAIGEAARGGGRAWAGAYGPSIDAAIERIGAAWEREERHWLWPERRGAFLTNLAVYYGALRSSGAARRSDEAARLCKRMREAAFAEYLRGTHFVSEKASGETLADIVAAAVPFGLITPGDLALVAAIGRLREDDVAGDAAALFAWYWAACKQPVRAKAWLERAAGAGAALFDAAEAAVAAEEAAASASASAVRFDHDPLGGESPYYADWNERSPRLVTAGDAVAIRTFAEPYDRLDGAALELSVDGGPPRRVPLELRVSPEGARYWEATLEPFPAFVRVEYRFAATLDGVESLSPRFAFDVLQWADIDRAATVERREGGGLTLRLWPALDGALSPMLEADAGPEGDVAFRLRFDGEARGVAADAVPDGAYSVGPATIAVRGGRVSLGDGGLSEAALQALTDREGRVYKVRLRQPLGADEKLYGMGERFARLEFNGFELDNYVFNQYKDQGFRTYMPVPFFLSSAGYGVYLESSLYSAFRFGTASTGTLEIEADVARERPSLTWRRFDGAPERVVRRYAAATGLPKLPPKWAFGPWMSSNNWDSEAEVDRQLAETAKHGIPSTVMVIEQWSDEATFYIFNDAAYEEKPGGERFAYGDFHFPAWGRWPNPRGLVERIHERGIRVLLWQAPVMKFMEGIAHGQKDEDERYMIERGYGVSNADGSPYRIPHYEWFRGSLVPDFTHPEAASWWFAKRQYLFDEVGIDGMKTDGGECVYGSGVRFHDGRTGAEMRNEYPNAYVGAFHRYIDSVVPGGGITFSRAGYAGAQRMPLHWAGDEKSTFEAFRSSIVAGQSCGLSGIPFWGWDLGGFSGEIPTAELFIRSAQMAAFCPVMQYHAESKGEFNLDRTPWNIAERTGNADVLRLYKRYADMRMNLLPYIYDQAVHSSRTGVPLMRAMAFAFPDDADAAAATLQYVFGDALLVAPVAYEGATSVDVYLPEGRWLHLFDRGVRVGGRGASATVREAAALEDIPVFQRADTVLPLNVDGGSLALGSDVGNRVDRYETLLLHAYVADRIDGYAFEDDLGTRARLSAAMTAAGLEARVELAGDWPAVVCFAAFGQASRLTVDGEDAAFAQRGGDVLVPLAQGARRVELFR